MTKLSLILLIFTGCFSSIVDDPCEAGYVYEDQACVARTTLPDGGTGGGTDGGDTTIGDGGLGADGSGSSDAPDASDASDGGAPLVCVLPEVQCSNGCKNLQTDPDNCGTCGHACASGLCTMGRCVGEPVGHIVAIGHDYANYHASMARVLGNAVSLGSNFTVSLAWFPAATHGGVTAALAGAMAVKGRPWTVQTIASAPSTPSSLSTIDVLIVDGVTTVASGMAWASQLDAFLLRGGVVIVVEGAAGSGHLFAEGANLFPATSPVDVTNQQMVISSPADSLADQVIAPYLGEASSVSFPGVSPAVITTTGGAPVVIHLVR